MEVWFCQSEPDEECLCPSRRFWSFEAERDRLFAQLSKTGDFRRGSVSEKRKTVGRQLAAGEVAKVRREVARTLSSRWPSSSSSR
jgi:hypothetical protein